MSSTSADILLHPIRLRIVLALASERQMTTAEISERMPDVAQATLYRHVSILADAGLLEVVGERQVRGGVERTYALIAEAARLGREDVRDMSPEELLRGFAIFAGSLVEAFGRYVTDPRAMPGTDLLGYRQAALWLDEDERAVLLDRLGSAIGPLLDNGPATDRERVLLNTILIPDPAGARAEGSAEDDREA